jgi:hypothetical protein
MTQPSSEPPAYPNGESGKRDLLRDRRAVAIIGAAVVAVGALGYFVVLPMLSSSSSSSDSGLVAGAHHPHHVATAAAVNASAVPVAAATAAPVLNVRDPFSPLYVAPTAAASTLASPSPTVQATSVATTPPKTIVIQQPGPTVTRTTDTTVAKYTLVLDSVSLVGDKGSATVTLNGLKMDLVLGESFPSTQNGPFQLNEVETNQIATFSYGDSSFAMVVGETQTEN